MDAATDAVLFASLCAMWVTNAGSVASTVAHLAGADQLVPAAVRGATSFSVVFFSVHLPAFVPMFVARMESLKKERYRRDHPFAVLLKRAFPIGYIVIAGVMLQVLAPCKTGQEVASIITDVGLLCTGIITCLFGVPCSMHMLKLPVIIYRSARGNPPTDGVNPESNGAWRQLAKHANSITKVICILFSVVILTGLLIKQLAPVKRSGLWTGGSILVDIGFFVCSVLSSMIIIPKLVFEMRRMGVL